MEYTAHVQMPDAAMGAVLHDIVLTHHSVSSAALASGGGTWLSYKFHADSDDLGLMTNSSIRYYVSQYQDTPVPEGYEAESIRTFETAPMIVTCGNVVIHSEGI